MAAAAQFFNDSGWKGPFHFNGLAADPLPARSIQGCLRVEMIVDGIQQDLELPWGCMKAPMTPKGPTGRPSFVKKPGMIV